MSISRKRLLEDRNEDKIPMEADRGPHLLHLPLDILESILFESCNRKYNGVTQLRRERVCPEICQACVNILRSGLRKLENSLKSEVVVARAEFEKEMRSGPRFDHQRGQHQKLLSLRLFQLESLLSETQILKASVWSFASAGIWTYYDGALLDRYFKMFRQMSKQSGQYNVQSVTAMSNARRATARAIRKFTKKVYERLAEAQRELVAGIETSAEINKINAASSIALLQILECNCAVEKSRQVISQNSGSEDEEPQYTRLRAQYTMDQCWIGMIQMSQSLPTYDNQLMQVLISVQELVWITSLECLKAQQLGRFLSIFPQTSHACTPDHVLIHSHSGSSTYPTSTLNLADDFEGTRAFFYGLRSPVPYHRADSSEVFLPPGYDAKRQFFFAGHVFDYPTSLDDPRVTIDLDIVCETDDLPPSVFAHAQHGEMTVGTQSSLEVKLVSRGKDDTSNTLLNHTFVTKPLPVPERELDELQLLSDRSVAVTHRTTESWLDTLRRWKSGEPYEKILKTE